MMKSSLTSWRLIKAFEGFKEKAEQRADGKWVIGYGHIKSAESDIRVTAEEAHLLLRFDLQSIEKCINNHVHTLLSQNQFDALVSFVYNIGEGNFLNSEVLKRLNAGEFLKSAQAFDIWRQAKIGDSMQLIDALVRRRSAEKALFLTPDNGVLPASGHNLDIHPDLAYALRLGVLSEQSELSPMDQTMKDLSERFENIKKSNPVVLNEIPSKEKEWPEIEIEDIQAESKQKETSEQKETLRQAEKTPDPVKTSVEKSEKTISLFDHNKFLEPLKNLGNKISPVKNSQTEKKEDLSKQKDDLRKQNGVKQDNPYFQKPDFSESVSEEPHLEQALEANVKKENKPPFYKKLKTDAVYIGLTLTGLLITLIGFVSYLFHTKWSYFSMRSAIIFMFVGVLIAGVSLYFWYRMQKFVYAENGEENEVSKKFKGKDKELSEEIKLEDEALRKRLKALMDIHQKSNSSPTNQI